MGLEPTGNRVEFEVMYIVRFENARGSSIGASATPCP